MTPDAIHVLRVSLQLSQKEFGEALGFTDGRRIVGGWETGIRNGVPYGPTGSALAAMRYLEAIVQCLDADLTADAIRERLKMALPEFMREKA